MNILRKGQISISFNTVLSILVGIIVFIIVIRVSDVFISYSRDKTSYEGISYLELSLKNLYAESNYVKKIKLNKPTEFFFDSENLVMPELKKTIPVSSNLIVAPSFMKTQKLTLFNKRSDSPIKYIDYLFLYPSDYKILIYNSSDPLARLIYSELPDTSYDPVTMKQEVLIDKHYVDRLHTIYQMCGRRDFCYVIFFNAPSAYESLDLSRYKNLKAVLVTGEERLGNVTFSSRVNITFFDKYTLLSAIVSNDLKIYNSIVKKVKNLTKTNYLLESKRLSYLLPLEPNDRCRDLIYEVNDTLFNINYLISNMDFEVTKINYLNANISLLNQKYYFIRENDCYI